MSGIKRELIADGVYKITFTDEEAARRKWEEIRQLYSEEVGEIFKKKEEEDIEAELEFRKKYPDGFIFGLA